MEKFIAIMIGAVLEDADLREFLRRTRPELVVSFLSYFSVLTAARAAGIGACRHIGV